PRGSRVTVGKPTAGESLPTFLTLQSAKIEANNTEVNVLACDAEFAEGELLGYGTGKPRQSVSVKTVPIFDATRGDLQPVIGVETPATQLGDRSPSVKYKDKVYRVWTEVGSFSNLSPNALAYVVDRMTGTVTFAPAIRTRANDGTLLDNPQLLASVPDVGREI